MRLAFVRDNSHMPELPEVEVTRRSFAERIARCRACWRCAWASRCAGRWAARPSRWSARTVGDGDAARQVPVAAAAGAAGRRGGLLMHLGMSGSLALRDAPPRRPGRTITSTSCTTRGTLRLTDPRRFGAVVWSPALDAAPAADAAAGLGVEPFDPALDAAGACTPRCSAARVAIKTALLAGDIVVGAGNIYACEALVRRPASTRARAADRLSRPRCERLLAGAARTRWRARSNSAARRCATSATRTAWPARSRPQAASTAARASPAVRCGAAVRRIVQAQRSTFFCPRCQRR